MQVTKFREALECLYERYNRREYVHPDPLEFLYAYPDVRDREVAGLVAASLAVGRVAHILRSVGVVLERLGPHPGKRVAEASAGELARMMAGVKHRFLTGENVAAMLDGAGRIIRRYGSLEACFSNAERASRNAELDNRLCQNGAGVAQPPPAVGFFDRLHSRGRLCHSSEIGSKEEGPVDSRPASKPWRMSSAWHMSKPWYVGDEEGTVLAGLGVFAAELTAHGDESGRIVSHPRGKSACKKLNLYLRWMVRSDDVDPGGWRSVHPRQLIVPLDVHMHRMGRLLGLTDRKQADLAAALEVTAAFRAISPDDPVKYDFALTRLGIRADTDREAFLGQCLAACGGK